ncbi:hypothetical protein AGMMS49982_17410 [Bacteroidia bacterium]|nr:hypothetical protein AGMMS49982_17410 [Bacteroidia bacterium]
MGAASAVFTSCADDDPVPPPLIEMVPVAGGSIILGVTEVTLSSFQIGKYEVTQKLWWSVMDKWLGDAPSPTYGAGDNYPMYNVSYTDIQLFLAKLNTLTGKNYRLPTEVEWEYAAKGGRRAEGHIYSGSDAIDDVAWYWGNIPSQDPQQAGHGTQPVGMKLPNALGIYDMTGNVWEWCNDWYGPEYPSGTEDPTGAATAGSFRVFRGGSWYDNATYCRVSDRYYFPPGGRISFTGFRLVLPL